MQSVIEINYTVGDLRLTQWHAADASYQDERGGCYFSGASEPSPEDAADCIETPRLRPLAPAAPREISKLTVRRRLRDLGKEAAFDSALDAIPGARADWQDAQVLRTDDPLFSIHAAGFKVLVGLSDEDFAAVLA